MSEKVITAGDDVDSWCTTCKLVLAHRVVAVVDGKPEKVICSTCQKKHKYRPNPPKYLTKKAATGKKKASGKTTKKRTTRTRRTKDPSIVWEEALADKDISRAKNYSMAEVFDKDDIIEHEKFGRGLVKEIHAEWKMEVLFKEGIKLLVFGRKELMRNSYNVQRTM